MPTSVDIMQCSVVYFTTEVHMRFLISVFL